MKTNKFANFRSIYCSGPFVRDGETLSAMSLLFEKIYLPNNIELIKEFVKQYKLGWKMSNAKVSICLSGEDSELFYDLTDSQRESAHVYIMQAIDFAKKYSELFNDVLESDMFPNDKDFKYEIVDVKNIENNMKRYTFSSTTDITFAIQDNDKFKDKIDVGYIPILSNSKISLPEGLSVDVNRTKSIASLLAMKSVKLALPPTKSVNSQIILEARHKLKDQLPAFWSSMIKLTAELEKLSHTSTNSKDLPFEAEELVERIVRPALIDLNDKLERERKLWFYNILSPIRTGIKLLIGNPPVTQQQLLTNGLILASDTCSVIAGNMNKIESLKRDSGLAYIIDLAEYFEMKK